MCTKCVRVCRISVARRGGDNFPLVIFMGSVWCPDQQRHCRLGFASQHQHTHTEFQQTVPHSSQIYLIFISLMLHSVLFCVIVCVCVVGPSAVQRLDSSTVRTYSCWERDNRDSPLWDTLTHSTQDYYYHYYKTNTYCEYVICIIIIYKLSLILLEA